MAAHRALPVPTSPPRVLIVDDEFFEAMMIDDMLRDLGYGISAWALDVRSARQELRKKDFDVALLNIVLDGRRCPELADALLEMGKPFVFVNDARETEQRHATVPLLNRPFTPAQMRSLLEPLVGAGRRGAE